MTHVIMINTTLKEEHAKVLSYVLEQAGISHEFRIAQSAIIVYGDSDVVRKAKTLITDHGFDIM